jgi:hypothetical protein
MHVYISFKIREMIYILQEKNKKVSLKTEKKITLN